MPLLADVSRLVSQEDVVSTWEPVHSLLENAVSGTEIEAAPCFPALAVTCLPLYLLGRRALYGSWLALLCYLFNPLLCKCSWGHRAVLEPFVGKVLLCVCASLAILIWAAISH